MRKERGDVYTPGTVRNSLAEAGMELRRRRRKYSKTKINMYFFTGESGINEVAVKELRYALRPASVNTIILTLVQLAHTEARY